MILGKVGEDFQVGVAQSGESRGGAVGLGAGGLPIEQVERGALSGIPGVQKARLDSFHGAGENDVAGGYLVADRHGQLAFAGERRQRKQDPEEDGAAHSIIAGPPNGYAPAPVLTRRPGTTIFRLVRLVIVRNSGAQGS